MMWLGSMFFLCIDEILDVLVGVKVFIILDLVSGLLVGWGRYCWLWEDNIYN